MDDEGSIVLETLAEHDLLEDFLEAIDSDDIPKVISLMRRVQIDEEVINLTIRQIRESHFNH